MHINTPPLNLLRSTLLSTRFTPMSLNPTRIRIRVNPIFPRVFPKLKHQSFASGIGVRALSTRSFRAQPDSGLGRQTPLSKSLIEDEDELDNWVSSLRTSSLRSGACTEDEDDEEGAKRGRVKRGNGDEGRMGIRNSEGFERNAKWGRDGDVGGGGGEGRMGVRNSERFERNGKRGRGGNFGGGGGEGRMGIRNSERFERNGKRGRDGNFGGGSEGKMGIRNSERFGVGSERKGVDFGRNVRRGRDGNFGNAGEDKMGARSNSRFGGGFERKAGDFERNVKRGREGNFGNDGEGRIGIKSSGKFERNEKRGNERDVENRGGRGRGRDTRGGYGGGLKGVVKDDEEEDEEFGSREGKSVSDFVSLIGDEDSDEGSEDNESEEDVLRSRASLFPNEFKKHDLGSSLSEGNESYLSETRFDQCAINPLSLKAIKAAGYEKMTVVQEATLPVILKGKDVMAKARTGTGKTVAFLLPSIEAVLKTPPSDRDQKRPPILVLVVCPTRELATQAAAEANNLVMYHPSIGVQVVMGGTRLAVEQKRMQANPCQILVATPGRLRDHLENTAGFATRLMGIKVLVLDEADHLLDMGFRKDIEKIVAATPKERQTLLFSATIPNEVRQICHIALKRDHEYINTVQEGSGETHSQVKQMHLVAPLENQFPLLYSMLKEHISDDVNYKVLVFCTTAMVTRLVADLLGELNLNVREIHSRKPQSYRTRVSDEFRKSKGLILVTSDVSARGVDYPDVTLVIQLGLPSDREQYIHRLGRTGRKGKEGQGVLLLAPWEEFFMNSIKDIPISKASLPMVDPDTKKKVERALSNVEMKNKEAAYQAWLGYYNSNKTVGRDKMRLVELANEFSRSMGLDNPPAISKVVIGKMGLKNVPGLRTK